MLAVGPLVSHTHRLRVERFDVARAAAAAALREPAAEVAGGGESAGGAAVVGAVVGNNLFLAGEAAGDPDGGLVRLGAACESWCIGA